MSEERAEFVEICAHITNCLGFKSVLERVWYFQCLGQKKCRKSNYALICQKFQHDATRLPFMYYFHWFCPSKGMNLGLNFVPVSVGVIIFCASEGISSVAPSQQGYVYSAEQPPPLVSGKHVNREKISLLFYNAQQLQAHLTSSFKMTNLYVIMSLRASIFILIFSIHVDFHQVYLVGKEEQYNMSVGEYPCNK